MAFGTDSWDPVLAKVTTWPIHEGPVLETLLEYILVVFAEMRAGTIGATSHIADSDYSAAKSNPDLIVTVLRWATNFHVFGFNQKSPLWGNNLKLRQATIYATDRKSLATQRGAPTLCG